MNTFTIEYKQLYKLYNKKLKEIHDKNFGEFSSNMEYFITYLKFLRDYAILTEPLVLDSGEENLKIATLATAIAEYEKFNSCIYSYYSVSDTGVLKKIDGTDEEVTKKYNEERNFHWANFWNIIKANIEGWVFNAKI